MSTAQTALTLSPLKWQPYLKPVEIDQATPEQRDAMKVTPSNQKISSYVLTLALDPEALAQRTPLFNGIMYAEGGLSRGERELGALAASIVNHCAYCASVHGNRFVSLTKDRETAELIFRDLTEAKLSERLQAIFDFAMKLTRNPMALRKDDIGPLRAVGLSNLEIHDLIHASAIFGWANRLMHPLGEAVSANAQLSSSA